MVGFPFSFDDFNAKTKQYKRIYRIRRNSQDSFGLGPDGSRNSVFLHLAQSLYASRRKQVTRNQSECDDSLLGKLCIDSKDWAYDARNPLASPIFTAPYLFVTPGPNGDCRHIRMNPTRHCLTRNYDASNFSTFYDHAAIQMLLDSARTMAYDEYRRWIETAPHGIVHSSVGGRGGDMTSMQSPNDPIFWLHHGMIDKLWDDFQRLSGDSYRQKTIDYLDSMDATKESESA